METLDLDRLKAQDREQFAAIVRLYHRRLLATARAIVGAAQAEEVVQEAWLSAWRALPAFEGRSSLKTWLTRIVINAATSRQRRDWRQVSLEAISEDNPDFWQRFDTKGHWTQGPVAWSSESPDALLQQGELGDCVERTLHDLPALQHTVFVLHHIDEMAPEEVCNSLNISESNRRVLLHRARLRLFESVEHFQETGEC
jgi:RNA polymerase sigma-70 factor (ECF subfamily)